MPHNTKINGVSMPFIFVLYEYIKMVKDFKHNDLVLNFYRGIAYRLTKKFYKYSIDLYSRCRLATFEEEEKFNLFKSEIVPLVKIVGKCCSKWEKLENKKITVFVNNEILRAFRDFSEEINSTDYTYLINYIIRRLEDKNFNKKQKNELKEIKSLYKQQTKVLADIKNKLKNL